MLQQIDNYVKKGESFAFETTLASLGYVKKIKKWRAVDYKVKLIFLSLATPEEATNRVKSRVAQGGHPIPEAVIRRRFSNGLNNLENIYRHCVDYWQLINNSSAIPILIEKGENP